MRHWNGEQVYLERIRERIFTLPMRHWNMAPLLPLLPPCRHIFTLPMRHWNNSTSALAILLQLHIFTLPMRHWNLKQSMRVSGSSAIFTLPMRHWNSRQKLPAGLMLTIFLPYLWGIETLTDVQYLWKVWLHFYPTYEALKRGKILVTVGKSINFYPTYEALKLCS